MFSTHTHGERVARPDVLSDAEEEDRKKGSPARNPPAVVGDAMSLLLLLLLGGEQGKSSSYLLSTILPKMEGREETKLVNAHGQRESKKGRHARFLVGPCGVSTMGLVFSGSEPRARN